MSYKDVEKQKEATRERVRRYREKQKGVTKALPKDVTPIENVTPNVTPSKDVTPIKRGEYASSRTFGYATKGVPGPTWLQPK